MGLRIILLIIGWSMVAHAEFRKWQGPAGKTIEAEFVEEMGNYVWVRDRKNILRKLKFKELSENDRLYIQLQDPPAFRLKSKTKRHLIRKPEEHRERESNQLIVTRTDRPSYICSVDIKRKDGKQYGLPLHLHIYWASVKYFPAKEQGRSKQKNAIVLKKRETKQFKLDSVEYGQSWTWKTEPVGFVRKERILHTRQDNNQGEYKVKTRTVLELDKYFGTLVVVVDEGGKILAMESDKPKLEKIHRQIMQAAPGQVLTGVDSHD